MKKILCLLSLSLLGQAHAAGYFRSGSDLEALSVVLASMKHTHKASFAKGYVSGVADATLGSAWCPDALTTEEQTCRIVADFIRTHPGAMKLNAATIVVEALAADSPCEKK